MIFFSRVYIKFVFLGTNHIPMYNGILGIKAITNAYEVDANPVLLVSQVISA